MRCAFLWDVTQRSLVIPYWRFGITRRFYVQGPRNPSRKWISWPLKLGPKSFPEISVRNYHFTLRNVPEEGVFHRMLEPLSSFTCVVETVASLVWDRRLPTIWGHPQLHHHHLWPTYRLHHNIFPLHRAKYRRLLLLNLWVFRLTSTFSGISIIELSNLFLPNFQCSFLISYHIR